MQRMTFGGLELSVIDPHERDTRYIYDEIFVSQIYYHPEMRIPKHPIIMDVGVEHRNLRDLGSTAGTSRRRSIATRRARGPFRISKPIWNASSTPRSTKVHALNRPLASVSGRTLTLHQSPLVSGISTLLDKSKVRWVQQLSASDEILTHEVVTSTVSAEMAANRIPAVDILKIDVEGYFMEVLKGIAEADFERIRNIVVEIDYSAEAEVTLLDVEDMLTARGYQTDHEEDTFYAWRR